MTGKQVRDARKLLNRTQNWVARRSGFPGTILSIFERTNHMPLPMHGSRDRQADLKAVLEAEGVVFTAQGVRLADRTHEAARDNLQERGATPSGM